MMTLRGKAMLAAVVAAAAAAGAAFFLVRGAGPAPEDGGQAVTVAVLSLQAGGWNLERCGVAENLVETGYDYMEPEPQLVESWERLGGGAWRLRLRRNVLFHNGDAMDAELLCDALDEHRKRTPDFETSLDLTWEAEDPHALLMRTPLTGVFLPEYLGRIPVFHPASFGPDGRMVRPIGTGPFRAVRVSFGDEMELEAFDAYWGGRPKLRRITVKEVKDHQTRALLLESGQVQWSQMILRQEMDRLEEAGFRLVTSRFLYNIYILFHCGRPPFDDPRVRRAFNWAVDRKAVVDAAFEGKADPASLFFPGSAPFAPEGLASYACDPGRARSLLREAGWAPDSEGFFARDGRPLSVRLLTRGNRPAHQIAGQVIQQQLRDAGIRCEMEVREYGAWSASTRRGDYQCTVTGRCPSWVPDPAGYFATDWVSDGGNNLGFYRNEEVDRLVKLALHEEDPAERKKAVEAMIRAWWADAPIAMLCHDRTRETYGVSPELAAVDEPFSLIHSFPGAETHWK